MDLTLPEQEGDGGEFPPKTVSEMRCLPRLFGLEFFNPMHPTQF